jgi:murein DD-endopeptidase MepM/ murein hydrolase activator NlpD
MTSLASVFVEVRPDTSQFSGQLKASLAKSREAVDVAAKLDTAQLKPQLDKLKADLKAITLTKASIAVDSAQATAKLKTLRAELNGLREKVKVDADTAGIKERIAAVKAEIASVGNQKATLNVDTAAASAHITALSAQLSAFGGQDFTAHVNVDGGKGGIGVRLAGIADGFADIGSKMSTVMTVAGAVGPAILAVGAALSAAAAGGVALGGVLASAGGAGAALGVTIKADIKEYQDLKKKIAVDERFVTLRQTQVAAARASLAGATKGTASYASASRRLKDALDVQHLAQEALNTDNKTLTQQFGPLERGMDKYKAGMGQLTLSTRPQVIGLMGHSLQVVAGILPRLAPLVRATATAVDGLVTQFGEFTKTDQFQGILNWFTRTGPAAIGVLGHSVGDLFISLLNVFRIGSSPTGRGFLDAIETASSRFRTFTESADGIKKIGDWFKTGRDNLAAMGRLVKAVGGGLSDMGSGKSLAPLLDMVTNKIIPPLMKFLNNASAAGALNSLVGAVGAVLDVFASLSASDKSLRAFADTLGAFAAAAGFVVKHVPGASDALAFLFTTLGAWKALKLIGLAGVLTRAAGATAELGVAAEKAGLQAEAAGPRFGGLQGAVGKIKGSIAGLAGPAGVGLLLSSVHQTNHTVGTLESTLGGAAVGFSVGGPWGAAIGGAGGLIFGLAKHFKGAGNAARDAFRKMQSTRVITGVRRDLSDLKGTLDSVTGAYTETTRAAVLQKLQQNGVLAAGRRFGISAREMVNSVLGQGSALTRLSPVLGSYRGKIAAIEKQQNALSIATDKYGNRLKLDVSGNLIPLTKKEQEHYNALEKTKRGYQANVDKIKTIRPQLQGYARNIQSSTAATRDYTGMLKGIPARVRSEIQANGIIPTAKGVADLATKYKIIDKRQIKTLIAASGTSATLRDVQAVIDKINRVPKVFTSVAEFKTTVAKAASDAYRKYVNDNKGKQNLLSRAEWDDRQARRADADWKKYVNDNKGKQNLLSRAEWDDQRASRAALDFRLYVNKQRSLHNLLSPAAWADSKARGDVRSYREYVNTELGKVKDRKVGINLSTNAAQVLGISRRTKNQQATSPLNRATGGPVRGAGTETSDSIPALLSNNEHVWTAKEVRAVGGHGAMEAIRAAVRSGRGVARATGGPVTLTPATRQGAVPTQQIDNYFGRAAQVIASAVTRMARLMSSVGVGGGRFRPVKGGTITQGIHDAYTGFPALDFGVPVGTPVHAGASGRVTISRDLIGNQSGGFRSYGRYIQLNNGPFSTLYAHLSRRMVSAGQSVAGGQVIGLSGNTGNSRGPHLHFGARGISPRAFLRDTPGGSIGAVTGSVRRFAGVTSQVLRALRQPQSLIPAVLRRMNQESAGRVDAVNRTDSNARAGHPSTGLMQVIRGTYAAYRPHPDFGPYMNGVSINPYSNIYAGLNYARHRYSSIAYAMNKPGGYDRGGVAVGKGVMLKNVIAPERVLDPRSTRNFEVLTHALDRLDTDTHRGRKGGGGPQRIVLETGPGGVTFTGFIEDVADDRVAVAKEFANTRRRMR